MFPTKPVSPRSTCQVWYNRRPQPRALTLSAGEAMASRVESWRTGTRIWRDTHWLYISSMVCCKIHHLIRNCPIYRTINLYRGFPLPRLFYRKVVFLENVGGTQHPRPCGVLGGWTLQYNNRKTSWANHQTLFRHMFGKSTTTSRSTKKT